MIKEKEQKNKIPKTFEMFNQKLKSIISYLNQHMETDQEKSSLNNFVLTLDAI